MLQSGFIYSDVADFIRDNGVEISVSSVHRYASALNTTIENLRMAHENFRVVMEEVSKYPLLDTSEGIIRLLSHQVLEAIQHTPTERWKEVEPEKLMKQASALVRAAAYKSNIDLKNKEILDTGYEQVKKMVFDAMMKERPDLYNEVSRFLSEKQQESGDAE